MLRAGLQQDWRRGNVRELRGHVSTLVRMRHCDEHFTQPGGGARMQPQQVLAYLDNEQSQEDGAGRPGRKQRFSDQDLLEHLRAAKQNGQPKGELETALGIKILKRRIAAIQDEQERKEAQKLWEALPRKRRRLGGSGTNA